MLLFRQPSLVSLLIETIGVLLFATLCLILQKITSRRSLLYWAIGWFALFIALGSLFLAFRIPSTQLITKPIYVFGEYVFAYMVIAGCRRFVSGKDAARADRLLIVPAAILAIFLPHIGGGDFNVFFAAHTLMCAYLFLVALRLLWRVWPNRGSVFGVRIVKIALLLLTIDYAHYAVLFVVSTYRYARGVQVYMNYWPLYDFVFLVLLAFGMVMVATGEVQYDLEVVNARLAEARDRLETIAKLDNLTSALNRHAFYSIVGDSRAQGRVVFRGCAAIADIDNLKVINDRYGHYAGDAAIRAVGGAIRSCIRADDLLFRWGGDEFLVLLIGMSEADARARLEIVNGILRRTIITGVPQPVDVSVALGYASFESAAALEEVVALADTAMYGRKRAGV
jgi:diguanylate cyclase (GGDEF)-like protein